MGNACAKDRANVVSEGEAMEAFLSMTVERVGTMEQYEVRLSLDSDREDSSDYVAYLLRSDVQKVVNGEGVEQSFSRKAIELLYDSNMKWWKKRSEYDVFIKIIKILSFSPLVTKENPDLSVKKYKVVYQKYRMTR